MTLRFIRDTELRLDINAFGWAAGLPVVLAALDATVGAHDVAPASVALAWLRAQPTVTSPIASARSVKQVAPLAAPIGLELTAEGLQALDVAARPVQARARPAHLAPDLP